MDHRRVTQWKDCRSEMTKHHNGTNTPQYTLSRETGMRFLYGIEKEPRCLLVMEREKNHLQWPSHTLHIWMSCGRQPPWGKAYLTSTRGSHTTCKSDATRVIQRLAVKGSIWKDCQFGQVYSSNRIVNVTSQEQFRLLLVYEAECISSQCEWSEFRKVYSSSLRPRITI